MSSADFPGPSISRTDTVCICDLDGTLLAVNSFPYWVLYMLVGRFAGLCVIERLALSFVVGRILFARKIRRRNHGDAKRMLQQLWMAAASRDPDRGALRSLHAILQNYVRPNVKLLLQAIGAGETDALLATAAAGEYAQAFGKALGFAHVLTTPLCGEADSIENCGERKRDRVLAALEALGWSDRVRVLLTDHEDDLPLMQVCQRTLWFGSYEDVAPVQQRAPETRVIFARNTSDVEVLRLACYR